MRVKSYTRNGKKVKAHYRSTSLPKNQVKAFEKYLRSEHGINPSARGKKSLSKVRTRLVNNNRISHGRTVTKSNRKYFE